MSHRSHYCLISLPIPASVPLHSTPEPPCSSFRCLFPAQSAWHRMPSCFCLRGRRLRHWPLPPRAPEAPGAGTTLGFSHCGIPSAKHVRAYSAFGEPTSPWGEGLTHRRRPRRGRDLRRTCERLSSPLPCPLSPKWEGGPERTVVRDHPEWARARLKASMETVKIPAGSAETFSSRDSPDMTLQ